MRLVKGYKIYNVTYIMRFLKNSNKEKVLDKAKENPEILDNHYLDFNRIEYFFNVSYVFKGFELFLMIINVSYFSGIIWMIFCQFLKNVDKENESFHVEYDIDH